MKVSTRVQLPALQPTNARFTPGRGTAFLKTLRDRYKRNAARIDMVSVTSAVTFTRTPADTRVGAIEHPQIPYPWIRINWLASPLRETQPCPRPLHRKDLTKANSLQRAYFCRRKEDMGPMLDALEGRTLARMFFFTANVVQQEHRMPIVRSLRHALRIVCQAYNALQVASAGCPHDEALVTNLEKATKRLRITPALLQSSDGRCSREGRYSEYTKRELTGLIDWLVVFAGRSRHKGREDTPEDRRVGASKLAHEKGGIAKAASALISRLVAPQDSRTPATLRSKHRTGDPVAIATGEAQTELQRLVSRSNSRT